MPGVGTESLRADSGLSRGYPETICALGGALQAAVSACSAPEPAGMPACAGAAAAGWVRPRRSRSPCVHESAGWRAAWELTHAGGAGEAVAGAVVSDTAGFSGCWGVRMESLRADSGLSRGYPQRPPARLAGPCKAAVSACSAPELAGMRNAGVRWRCRRRVGATEAIQEPVCARERRPCAAWKLTHPGGAGGAVAGAVVSDVAGDRLPQSRPYPRGGSTLSNSARSSSQIASSLCASADSWRASGRLSSHA